MTSVIKVEILDTGEVRIDSRGAVGSVSDITKDLKSLAVSLGGELEIEKHEPGKHVHIHAKGKVRSHG